MFHATFDRTDGMTLAHDVELDTIESAVNRGGRGIPFFRAFRQNCA